MEWLLKLWHDLYYKVAGDGGVKFALTCKEAVSHMDLHEPPKDWRSYIRLKLHLSLCQACRYYRRTSQVMGRAVRDLIEGSGKSVDINKLNRDLVKKFSKPT